MPSMQDVHCPTCGGRFKTNFFDDGGYKFSRIFCCKACFDHLEWIKSLAIRNESYTPMPSPVGAKAEGE